MNENNLLLDEVIGLNEHNKTALRKNLHMDNWTLCLGAGVSKSAGLPDWYTLLSKMMARLMCLDIFSYDKKQTGWEYKKAKADLVKQYGKSVQYKSKLTKAINGNAKNVFEGQNTLELAESVKQLIEYPLLSTSGDDELVNFYIKHLVKESCIPCTDIDNLKTGTLGSVTKLLSTLKPHHAKHVITYNYDNLLEECLRTFGNKSIQIYSVSENPKKIYDEACNSCIIYHVHGCIPVNKSSPEKESAKIILTETSYYDAEQTEYSWSNVVQIQRMASSVMLFIGFSGQDYNFRRILKNMEKNRTHQHYILFCIDDYVNRIFKIDSSLLEDRNYLKENCSFELILLNQMLNAQYIYWFHHGLIPIWTTIEQIPNLIESLI